MRFIDDHIQDVVESTTDFIPHMLGTLPRNEYCEEYEEDQAGQFAKEFKENELGREVKPWARTILFVADNKFFDYMERCESAVIDALDRVRELEEIIARSGNGYLMQDAHEGAKAHGKLVRELERERAEKEAYKLRCDLITELYEDAKRLLVTTTSEKVGVDTKITELTAEKYGKKSYYNSLDTAADDKKEEQPRNGHQFGNKDGKSMKLKQKAVFVGALFMGMSKAELMEKYNISDPVCDRYYREGRKMFVGYGKDEGGNYYPSWAEGCKEADLPMKSEFSTSFERVFNEFINESELLGGAKFPARLSEVAA